MLDATRVVRPYPAQQRDADVGGPTRTRRGPVVGAAEIGIIAAVIILLFGARKLPELAGAVGKSIKEFRKASEDDDEDGSGGGAAPSEEA